MATCRSSVPPEERVTPPSSGEEREQLALFCKALAHPARIQIVQFLAGVDTCFCGDIVKQLPLAQSTVSQHLKILKEAGIVQGEIDGPRTCYWLSRERLAQLKALMAQLP
jgi:ArsR family transcriptional regulator, arsenate/arsenite/antimonite-responsive transcriptional repressor